MRESDEQFLERFRTEIEPFVRDVGTISGMRIEVVPSGERVRIVVAVDGRIGPIELVLEGDSLLDAMADWKARISEARLALAFREVVLSRPG
jgi:hypothetical protein